MVSPPDGVLPPRRRTANLDDGGGQKVGQRKHDVNHGKALETDVVVAQVLEISGLVRAARRGRKSIKRGGIGGLAGLTWRSGTLRTAP